MVQTVKFSQFVQGGPINANSLPVGLQNGTNTIWLNAGGGGSGGVTFTITQAMPTLTIGEWVMINPAGQYVGAKADTPTNGEVIGVVVAIPAVNQYTIQQSGYVTTASGVFSGLTTSDVYFLSTTNAGQIVNLDATINGQVSRPCFVADTPTSGWVVPYRGLIVGGVAPSGGGGAVVIPSIVTVTQMGHGLNVGNVVYLSGSLDYMRAIATSLATSQAVGVVIQVISANQFVLQTEGYNDTGGTHGSGAITVDDLGNPIIASTVYYLSSTVAGFVTAVNPVTNGLISKPIFISEQVFATTGIDAGYILPQRPIPVTGSPASPPIFLGNLNAANNFDSTTAHTGFSILGYNALQLNMNAEPTFPGTAGIRATNATPISVGFQLHNSAGWVNPPNGGNSYYTYGINSRGAINPGPGTFYSQIQNDATNSSMILMPPIATTVDFTGVFGTLNIISLGGAFGGVLSCEAFFVDNSSMATPNIGYVLTCLSLCASPLAIDGIRVFFGAGATVTPGSLSYISVFGLPNT